MKTRQLYRYLYSNSSLSPEEVKAMPQFFEPFKRRDEFRQFLRNYEFVTIDKQLYEEQCSDDHHYSPFKVVYADKFKQINDQYGYLANDDEQVKVFQCLYNVFAMCDLDIHGGDRRSKHVYNAMVYFGIDNNPETILEILDNYCHKNGLYYSTVLSKSLNPLTAPMQLTKWQRFMVSSDSPDALRYFDIASEMKAFVPNNIAEAKQWLQDLLGKEDLDHKMLWHIYGNLSCHYFNIRDQQFNTTMKITFFMSLSRNNLRKFINDPTVWYRILDVVTQSDMQKELFERLDAETLKTMFSNLLHFRHILGLVNPEVASFLIKKIDMDVLLEDVESARGLAHFVRNYLSCRDPFTVLSEDIGYQRLEKYILTAKNLAEFRWILNFDKEKEFVLNYLDFIGKEKSVLLIKTAQAPYLSAILQCIKNEDRFAFIKTTLTPGDLLEMRKDRSVWKALKLTLNSQQRAQLDEYVYPKEELAAKWMLKNIKQTILNTEWSFWRYETPVTVELKKQKKQVPRSIQNQLNEIKAVSERKKTHHDAVKGIYLLGKAEKDGWLAAAGNKFFDKGTTERYFDQFESRESFDRAFARKSRSK